MSRFSRLIITVCATIIVIQVVALWHATGGHVFTQYDTALSASDTRRQQSFAKRFDGTGLEDDTGPMPNEAVGFRFGLLPATYPWRLWDPYFVSLLTVAGPACLAFAAVARIDALSLRKKRAERKTCEQPK